MSDIETLKDKILTEVGRPCPGGYLRAVVFAEGGAKDRVSPENLKKLQGAIAVAILTCNDAMRDD